MPDLANHPTVRAAPRAPARPAVLDADELRARCLALGADDVGFVEIDRPGLEDERDHVRAVFPEARAFVSFVVRMNRAAIRTPARSIANHEFHHTGDDVDAVARALAAELEARGVAALTPSMGFPMEMDRFPGRIWVISHKPVAVQAGLGAMGIHRNVIHPRFGNFVLLGTVAVDVPVSRYDKPVPYNPCLECKLCVAACPVGAIGADGHFNFQACYTHNYREFMGGFTDWVEQVADSRDARAYRKKVTDAESASVWQSLSHGANYKAAYCLSVCPAGEEVIGPWLEDRGGHLRAVVKPLQRKEEPLYVVPGSDADAHAARRFPHKTRRPVHSGLRPATAAGFFDGLPLTFQRGRARGVDVTVHFRLKGAGAGGPAEGTVAVRDGALTVTRGPDGAGDADVRVTADARAWIDYLAGTRGLLGALLTGKIRVNGDPRRLRAFQRCFAL